MANNELTLEKNTNTKENVENFLTKNRSVILAIVCAVVVVAVGISAYFVASSEMSKKSLASVEEIEYTYLKNAVALSDDEVEQRNNAALEALVPFLSKKNVAGVRANMLSAEIYFSTKDYEKALSCYLASAESGKKSYTAPIGYYNAAVCSEELGKDADALLYYEKAVSSSDFLLKSHALFSIGRLNEGAGNLDKAVEAYEELVKNYSDTWANLAQSRLLLINTAE